jgi:DNA invertase Pin-like site-specific DNA recombinase
MNTKGQTRPPGQQTQFARGQQNGEKLTILYERLSVEDERCNEESNSIKNQKALLEDYAKKQGFRNIVHITDDGQSGTRFDRPGFLEAMELVEAGRVENWLVKDLSMYGRDHLRVGLYTERLRECNVRFIAIQDNVDTSRGEDDFTPFRNIINEWAARDSSRKVKAVMKNKGMSGKRLTTVPIYGYNYDPNDKAKWVVEPEAADVVRRIFQMTIGGMGPHEIAKALTADKVERPSYYMNRRGIVPYKYPMDKPYTWNGATVSAMLSKPEYFGCTVNFRYYKDSYKDKHTKQASKDEWVIFPDTHDAIVESETWETAQKCRKTVKRTDSLGEANPLTGKMICADCGQRMYNHRKPHESPHYTNPNTGKTYMRAPSDVYSCSTHDSGKHRFEKACSLHHIRTDVVRELVLDTIRRVSGYVRGNEEEFTALPLMLLKVYNSSYDNRRFCEKNYPV